jgi:1-acyl-sn-glycerol-3-phosphate acyltransferase
MPEPVSLPYSAPPPPGHGAAPAWLRKGIEYILFYLLLGGFAVMCLCWSLPAALLARLLPAKWGRPLGQATISAGFRLYLAAMRGAGLLVCDLSALDLLRDQPGIVIVPNHPSLLDAVMVTSRLPCVVCIAKASIWDNLLLGGGMRLAGYVRNDAPRAMIRNAADAMREGRQLLIFPEGTRTPSGGTALGPFSRSFAVMARQAGATVQTVLIECESPYLRKGWPLFRKPLLPLRYRVRLGRRFSPCNDTKVLSDGVERYLRDALAGQH